MADTTKQTGDRVEDLAIEILERTGYEIITRNFRTRFGEIDIVAKDDQTIVFVEVKAKKDDAFGGGGGDGHQSQTR